MLNSRTLFPALFNKAGGGGSGQTIQVTELPEAVLAEKDKIYQYIGSTTETFTNGYFYKCVEHTTTEGGVITVTYKWENIPVMEVESGGGGITISSEENVIGSYHNKDLYCKEYTITGVTSLGQSSPVTFEAGFDSICDTLINATLVITQDSVKTTYSGYGIEVDGGGNHALMWNPLKASKPINNITTLKLIVVYTKQS